MPSEPQTSTSFRFFRAGGVDQVALSSGADLERLSTLDQKLWVALACPTRGLEIDPRTLDMIDTDHDGRIRAPEILGAIAWARQVFRDLDDLFDGGDGIPLASINVATPMGDELHKGAVRTLKNLGLERETTIRLAHVMDTEQIFKETRFNGDGVVPSDAADDGDVKQAIEDVIATMGSVKDRSGKPGVDADRVERFFADVTAYVAWLRMADSDPAILPLGATTNDAALAIEALRSKIDDYFARCRLAAYDARIASALGVSDAEAAALGGIVLAPEDEAVAKLPIARGEPGRPLPLFLGANPAYAARLAAFSDRVMTPLFGAKSTLTETEWALVNERFAAHFAWRASKPTASPVEKLGDPRLLSLANGHAREGMLALVASDAALAAESNQIESIEKMIRFRRDFLLLLRNFVSFSEFYGNRRGAFQAGTLYIDGRSCDLCLPVADVAKHASLAGLARAYLAYCECTRKRDPEKMTIVAAVTGGDVDNLMLGRNGVFYDRKGDDWDATITRIVENPISVRQAFWAPYKKFIRLVEEQLAKRASAADEEANKRLEAGATAAVLADTVSHPKDEKPKEPARKIDIGTVAAIGVAVGGIATFFSSVIATVLGLGMWMPLGVVALILAISGPSMLIAWLKLRQRNIGPILDANGWAVNAFARINVPFGGALTKLPRLPPGSVRSLDDPFAEKKQPIALYVVLAIAAALGIAWLLGQLDPLLPDAARASTVLHRSEPPAAPEK